MPILACQKDGKDGWKFGDDGECYPYNKGDIASEKAAWDKAVAQGKAIEANKKRE
jgi:hypothetical protein